MLWETPETDENQVKNAADSDYMFGETESFEASEDPAEEATLEVEDPVLQPSSGLNFESEDPATNADMSGSEGEDLANLAQEQAALLSGDAEESILPVGAQAGSSVGIQEVQTLTASAGMALDSDTQETSETTLGSGTSGDISNPIPQQLVDTNTAANGPPAAAQSNTLSNSLSNYLGYAALKNGTDGLSVFISGDIDLWSLRPDFLQEQGIRSLTIYGSDSTNDTLIVDLSRGEIPLSVTFHGGVGGFDSLVVQGASTGSYTPGEHFGDGVLESGTTRISFTGLEPVIVDGAGESFTFTTPSTGGGNDVLIIDSPEAGWNRISGTSGGVAFENITFRNISHFIIDTGANDLAGSQNDRITFNSDLVATGLLDLTIKTGAGDDIIDVTGMSPNGSVPVSIDGGSGQDELIGYQPAAVVAGLFTFLNIEVLTASSAVSSGGDLHLDQGTSIVVPDSLTIGSGNTLSGSGTVLGSVVVHGTLSPGNSPGIDNFASLQLAHNSVTVIELAGIGGAGAVNGHDQINVTGSMVLGGTLLISLLNGFAPILGQSFEVLNYGAATGVFDNFTNLVIGGGLMLKPVFTATGLTLQVVQHSAAITAPLIFIPGFGGSSFADDSPAGLTEWLLNRGLDPTKLVLEPLTNAYSNIVQSLINVGYTLGVDLFVANWDWRVPVATLDAILDGTLTNVTAAGITDAVYETGVDYLGYWLNQAVVAWTALGNASLAAVDMVTHSTGGLIARAYIESAAYGGTYGAKSLPLVNNFIQSAAPNEGTLGPYLMLNNDFSEKPASRVLARIIESAYELVAGGQTLNNPDGTTITNADLIAQGANAQTWFIARYVESLQDLVGTYAMLDLNADGVYEKATIANGGIENRLMKDLNGGADPNAFIDRLLGVMTVIYSGDIETTDLIQSQTGFQLSLGAKNEILPLDRYVGDLPGATTTWLAELGSNVNGTEGDGTVPTASAIGNFVSDTARLASGKLILTQIKAADAGVAVGHGELVNQLYAQQKTIEAITGVLPAAGLISTNLELSQTVAGLKLIQYNLINPVDFARELYDRFSALISSFNQGSQTDIQTIIGFLFESVGSLIGNGVLDATFAPASGGTVVFGVRSGYAFVGASGVGFAGGIAGQGVQLSGGKMGLILWADGTYTLETSGRATASVGGVGLSGHITLRSNNSGAVNQSIVVGTDTVQLDFAGDTPLSISEISADLELDAALQVRVLELLGQFQNMLPDFTQLPFTLPTGVDFGSLLADLSALLDLQSAAQMHFDELNALSIVPTLGSLFDYLQKTQLEGSHAGSLDLGPFTLSGGYDSVSRDLTFGFKLDTSYTQHFDFTLADLKNDFAVLEQALQSMTGNSSFQSLLGNGSPALPTGSFHLVGDLLTQVVLDLGAGISLGAWLDNSTTHPLTSSDAFLELHTLNATAELIINDGTFNLELGPVGTRFTANITHGSLDLTATVSASSSRIYLNALSDPSVQIASLFSWQADGTLRAVLPLDFSYNSFSTADIGRVIITVGAAYDLPTDAFSLTEIALDLELNTSVQFKLLDLLAKFKDLAPDFSSLAFPFALPAGLNLSTLTTRLGELLDFEGPALQLFTLIKALNLTLPTVNGPFNLLTKLGVKLGLGVDFNINLDAHLLALRDFLNTEFHAGITFGLPEFKAQLILGSYGVELASLIGSLPGVDLIKVLFPDVTGFTLPAGFEFNLNAMLPSLQAFLGLPSVPLSFAAIRPQILAALGTLPSLRTLLDYIQKVHINEFTQSLQLGPLTLSGGYIPDVKELRFNLQLDTSYSQSFDFTMADMLDALDTALQPLATNSTFQSLFGEGALTLPTTNSAGADLHLIGEVLAKVFLDVTAGVKLADLFPGAPGTFGADDLFIELHTLNASVELVINDGTFNLELGPVGTRFTANITHGSLNLTAMASASSSRIYLNNFNTNQFVWEAGGRLQASLPLDFSFNGFSTADLGRVIVTVGASYDVPTDAFKITKINVRLSGGNTLIKFINDLLDANDASFTATEYLGSASLGGFFQFNDLTLTVTATLSAGGVWGGSIALSATSATLFSGSSFSAEITPDAPGGVAIIGTYTIGSGFVLSIPTTAKMVIKVGEAFDVVASGVSLSYDPNGADDQVLATIQNATAISSLMEGLPTALLSNLVIRKDGFSFGAFTLNSALGSSPSFGEFITTTGAQLQVSNFSVAFGTGTTPLSLAGTVSLSLTGIKLFPNGGLITSSLTSATAAFDFSDFDGTSITGRLSLTLSGLELRIGDALLLTTNGEDIVLTPGQQILGTITSATLSSPKFAGLGTLAVTDLEIRQNGFSLGSLSWSSGGVVKVLGDLLHFDAVTITLTAFEFQYSNIAPPVIAGTIDFNVQGAVLFPKIPLLNLRLGALLGSFDFANAGQMTLTIPNFVIPLGDALSIDLGDVNLKPGQFSLAKISNVQLKAGGLFAGLPTITLPSFELTRSGFTLGDLSFAATPTVTIGDFISLAGVTLSTHGFKVDRFSTPIISGTISLSMTGINLFPGVAGLTSSFTGIVGTFDLGNVLHPGQFSLTVDSFALSLFDQLNLSTGSFTFTPGMPTLGTISTATLAFPSLDNLSLTINGLDIRRTGFSIASGQLDLPSFEIGGLLSLTAPRITVTNLDYTFGGSLTGILDFYAAGASLTLGAALSASIGATHGNYNLASKELQMTLNDVAFNIGGFADISATSATLSYVPTVGGTSKIFLGANGVNGFVGQTGGNEVGVRLSGGRLGVAVFKSATGVVTYALRATGDVAILGLPADSLSFSPGSIEFRINTAGLVSESVSLDGDSLNSMLLDFTTNETSIFARGLTLTVGSFVSMSGDFGFSKFTSGSKTSLSIGATNLNVTLQIEGVSVTLAGASFGLIIEPGATSAQTTYALIAQGGLASLNGVPGLTLSASGLQVRVRRGLNTSTAAGIPLSVRTPGGDVTLDFSDLGAGSADITDIQGHATLAIDGFVSVTGDFGFQKYTSAGVTTLAVGARNLSIVLGNDTANLTLANVTLGLIVKPGVAGAATTYALQATGSSVAADTSLNGVTGLTLEASDLLVRVRRGLDVSSATLPVIQTSGGNVVLDFANLGSGTSDVTDIQGHAKLVVQDFGSLEGSFGFQSYSDAATGARQIAIGATGLSVVVGSGTTNLRLANASLGIIVRPGSATVATTYALQAKGSSNPADTSLNGIDGLTLNASNLLVRVRKGLDVSATTGFPTSILTPGGTVTLDFAGLGSGTTDVTDVQGNVTLAISGFAEITGAFGFQTYLPAGGTDRYFAFGMQGSVSLTAGSSTFGMNNVSVGVLVKQSGGVTTYALQARGSSLAADTSLSGVSGFSLSATDLSVRVRRGLDVSAYPVGVPTSILIPNGTITVDFTGMAAGTSDVTDIQGHVSLSVDGFASLSGDFGIQKFTVAGGGSGLAFAATNVNVLLGTADTNLSITGATLAMVVQGGNYAIMARSGTVTLNGIADLSIPSNSLTLRVKHGLSPPAETPASIQTPGGSIALDFAGLGAGNVTEIQGTATLSVAGFVSLSGTFSFTKQVIVGPTSTVTKILVGASNVSAFIGTADESLGVRITGASLGLVIYRDSAATGSRYALQASAPNIELVGTPGDITLTGSATVAINATGTAVNETIPGTGTTVSFSTGANVKRFGGSLTLSVGSAFSLSGDFSISKEVTGTVTKVLLGAANIHTAIGTTVETDGGGTTYNLSDGKLGVVFYKDGATSLGYALSASATASVAVGSALSGEATINLRRNTTISAHNDTVTVGSTVVPIAFKLTEVATLAGVAFQKISLSNASLSIDDTIL
ncbi:hypothetical protein, partial [Prosthecobacter sp.]|uniref:beta strand repeat-containing protein n=1 Tax=Prosthecobacter sp. TaxID=1965333 RepID=UPI0024875261